MNPPHQRTERSGVERQPGLPRRFLRPFLLLALEKQESSYGYELFESVTSRGLVVDLAGVYRDLRTMEQHDLVSSVWEPSESGPARRVYTLSPAAADAVSEAVDELMMIRDGLSDALASFAVSGQAHLGEILPR